MKSLLLPESFNALRKIDTSAWPAWAAAIWPDAVTWVLVIASVAAIWLAATLVKLVIVFIGRRAVPKDQKFEATPWLLAASTARIFVFVLLMPVPLGLAGYDWRGLIDKHGPGAFAACVILVVAFVVANAISKSLRQFGAQAHAHTGADDTLIAFFSSLVKYIIFGVAIVFALSQLGFPAASLAAVLGAAGLAIGLALQDTLKSVAAGVMLAIFRPFRIGDYVSVAGLEGTISHITPFTTSLRQIDNKIVSITNDKVWGDPLINFTAESERRLDLFFDVSYDDDLDHALRVLMDTANAHAHVLHKDTTWTGVHALSDWSVKLRLRAWVATSDFVDIRADLHKMVKQAFDREGITIPYPHQVHVDHPAVKRAAPKPEAAS